MFTRDSISGLVCLAISLAMLVMTFSLPPASMVPIGPAFYPRIVLSVSALLSAILIFIDIRASRANAGTPAAATTSPAPNYRLVLATFILFGLYIAFLPKVGFRISTALFVLALQVTLEWPQSPKRWVIAIVIALGTSAISYLVFNDYLSLLLPRGTWSGM
jgi:hypothetical protein